MRSKGNWNRRAEFWRRIQISDACWLWSGRVDQWGYGIVKLHGETLAHRVMWVELHGPIRNGLFVCHHCDVPHCVSPYHLFLGTPSDNVNDMVSKGRQRGAIGTNNSACKVTEETVIAIRHAPQSMSCRYLAKQFGISASSVSRIRAGRGWRHLSDKRDDCGSVWP